MPARRASWKMDAAQCKRMARDAIAIADNATGENATAEYLEVATQFLRLAEAIAGEHVGLRQQ